MYVSVSSWTETKRNPNKVEKEQWSDAMRERVTFALQQRPLEDAENVTATSSASHGSTSTSSSRALSPRRRSASAISSASRGLHDGGGVLHEGGGALGTGKVGTTFSGGGESGGVAGMEDGRRRGTSILGGITALGAGGGMRTSDTAATRRGPEREVSETSVSFFLFFCRNFGISFYLGVSLFNIIFLSHIN